MSCVPGSAVAPAATSECSTTSTATATSSWRCCSCRSWSTTALRPPTRRRTRRSGRRRLRLRADFVRACWSKRAASCCRCCCAAAPTADSCCTSCRCSTNRLIRWRTGSLRRRSAARSCWPPCGRWWRAAGLRRRRFWMPQVSSRSWGRPRCRAFACPASCCLPASQGERRNNT